MDAQERRPIAEIFQQAWTQALAAVSGGEDEVGRLLARVQGLMGSSPEVMRRQARELSERLIAQRRETERRLDEALRRALARLRVPRRDEIARLSERLDGLSQRVEALSK